MEQVELVLLIRVTEQEIQIIQMVQAVEIMQVHLPEETQLAAQLQVTAALAVLELLEMKQKIAMVLLEPVLHQAHLIMEQEIPEQSPEPMEMELETVLPVLPADRPQQQIPLPITAQVRLQTQ